MEWKVGALAVALSAIALPPVHAQDTVRIRSTAVPRWGADVKLTPVWTIGQIDGPDELAFGVVDGFTVDKTGRFYVYDSKDAQLRQYDANAKYVRTIGRKGKGPGEYEWVTGMDIAQDSLLAIQDLSAGRVTVFLPDGKLRTNWTNVRATFGFENTFVVDRAGLMYIAVPRASGRGEGPLDESAMTAQPSLLLTRGDGTVTDSLRLPPSLTRKPSSMFFLRTADGGNNNFIAISHYSSIRSGGFVFGNGDALRFMIRPKVGPVRVVDRTWTPVPISSEERANWQEYADNFTKMNNGRTSYTIPSTKPAFRDLKTDHDARVWVSLYAPARKITLPPRNDGRTGPRLYWQQPATYDVFSDQGEYLARVVLPMRSQFLAARGNRLWVKLKGPDDEDMIRLYTIAGVK